MKGRRVPPRADVPFTIEGKPLTLEMLHESLQKMSRGPGGHMTTEAIEWQKKYMEMIVDGTLPKLPEPTPVERGMLDRYQRK